MSPALLDWVHPADPHEHASDVQTAFHAAFGSAPHGVWSAPGRVNLIGEHLDYNGGPVLPMAINHRTMVALSPRSDHRVRLRSQQSSTSWEGDSVDVDPADVEPWCRYPVGVLWAMRASGIPVSGFDAVVDGRVPFGSGLSSSAALTCAVALALADLSGFTGSTGGTQDEERARLAKACMHAENDFAGAPTGGMDQAVVLRAQAGHALLLNCDTFAAEQVPVIGDAEMLVVDTRTDHALTDGQYGGRRTACEQAAAELGVAALADVAEDDLASTLARLSTAELAGVVQHVVTETRRVDELAAHLRAGTLDQAGPVLLASHVSMRDDFVISTPELDLVVDSATSAGAAGARMTGGGFGGSAVVLCPTGSRERIAAAVSAAFADRGCQPPGLLAVSASDSASRVS